MGTLQSSIGLITGTDIVGTVNQLIGISARPRDRLVNRTKELQAKQQQLGTLTASVIGLQLAGKSLGDSKLFQSRTATSSDSESVSAAVGDSAVSGDYSVRTLQTAATHSAAAAERFDSTDEALGLTGVLSIRGSGFVDDTVSLRDLNGGRGVEAGIIRITDRSGASADVDLSAARTVRDVLTAINDADIDITATTQGDSFRLIDNSGGTGSVEVVQLGSGETAADLGLHNLSEAAGEVIGNAIELAGDVDSLGGVSLARLGGGSGLGTLGTLDLELADGTTSSIDLSSATTVGEIVDLINDRGLDLIARVNDAGDGLRLRDTSGGAGQLSVSSTDGTDATLKLTGAVDNNVLVGGSLALQTVDIDTLLVDLSGGNGPTGGSFTLTDSSGAVGAVNLRTEEITTVGQLIDAVNDLDIDVTARINDAGDGIEIVDNAGGDGSLTITDTGSGTAAKKLGIAGTAVGGSLSGSEVVSIEVTAEDTLESIVEKFNELELYAEATISVDDDGTAQLSVRSRDGGDAGRFGIGSTVDGLSFRTTQRGRDAVIALSADGGTQRVLSSADGVFEDEQTGLNLTVKQASPEAISITVADDPSKATTAITRFADQYNRLVDKLNEVSFFNQETSEAGLLFGSTEVLNIRSGFSRLLTGRQRNSGSVSSLAELGVRLDETGKLRVDSGKLRTAFEDRPGDVEKFFTDPDDEDIDNAFASRIDALTERYAGSDNGMLINKTKTLGDQVDRNNDRVGNLNSRLEAERERLLRQYYATEEAIARIQSNSQYASQISSLSL